jgi:hypothetical protein
LTIFNGFSSPEPQSVVEAKCRHAKNVGPPRSAEGSGIEALSGSLHQHFIALNPLVAAGAERIWQQALREFI